MSFLKASNKKSVTGAYKASKGAISRYAHIYGVSTVGTPYNLGSNISHKRKTSNLSDTIILTVNPQLDKLLDTEIPNAKAVLAKQLFEKYRKG
jgi:hypothetical protein